MTGQHLKKIKLPDFPGVYFFKKNRQILYIGRATSIRDRVRSYFRDDLLETRSPLIFNMVNKAETVKFKKTDSVLEAIILEANLIKKYKPPYNTDEKDDKSFNYVVITKEDFPQILVIRGRNLSLDLGLPAQISPKFVAGPFPSASALQEALKFIRKVFPYRDEKCKIGQKRPCFNRHLGLCPGTCTGEISKIEYAKTIKYITQIFEGKKNSVIRGLEKEMKLFIKSEEFEKASIIKKQIFALTHIRDVALIKKEDLNTLRTFGPLASVFPRSTLGRSTLNANRIEAYDVAHLGGKNTRGVMVVMENGEFLKKEYRTFIIKEATPGDDVGALAEMLQRRLKHEEWRFPDVVIIDGGKGQFNNAQPIIKKYSEKVKIISVVKDEKHKARDIFGDLKGIEKNDVIKINAEAHRFAISKYRKAEREGFLPKR